MHNRSSFVVSRSRYKIGSFAIDSIRAVFLHKSLPKNEFVCTNFYFSNRSRLLYLENNRRILLEARSITRTLQRMIHLSFLFLSLVWLEENTYAYLIYQKIIEGKIITQLQLYLFHSKNYKIVTII